MFWWGIFEGVEAKEGHLERFWSLKKITSLLFKSIQLYFLVVWPFSNLKWVKINYCNPTIWESQGAGHYCYIVDFLWFLSFDFDPFLGHTKEKQSWIFLKDKEVSRILYPPALYRSFRPFFEKVIFPKGTWPMHLNSCTDNLVIYKFCLHCLEKFSDKLPENQGFHIAAEKHK